MNILTIENLSKQFSGHRVIDSLSLSIPEHTLYGFIGKNGAGKTTTMKMILGFLRPDGGRITVCGEAVKYGSSASNQLVGWLPDVPEFYPYMTPREYLTLCGRLSGLSKEDTAKRISELLPLVGLDGIARRIRGFSRGMKQRLGIAQALLGKPRLLICDEPTSALDPAGRKEILDILQNVKQETTLLFSTHILSDVERICDTIGILDAGTLVLEGNLDEIRDSYRADRIAVTLLNPAQLPQLMQLSERLPGKVEVERKESSLLLSSKQIKETERELLKLLVQQQIELAHYERLEPTLEQIFLEVTKV